MDREVAEELVEFVLESSDKLSRSFVDVRRNCSEEEFLQYRKVASELMGDMLVNLIDPLPFERRAKRVSS